MERQKIETHCSIYRNKLFLCDILKRAGFFTTAKLKDLPFSAVHCCIFAATLHICKAFSSAIWGRAIPWWQSPTYHDWIKLFQKLGGLDHKCIVFSIAGVNYANRDLCVTKNVEQSRANLVRTQLTASFIWYVAILDGQDWWTVS